MDICTSVIEDVQKEDYLVIGGSNKKLKRVYQVLAMLKRVNPFVFNIERPMPCYQFKDVRYKR